MHSNAEGLNVAAALEAEQGQDVVPAADWLNLEADAVGDPGPDYKSMARSPFTITRQLRRPFIVGLDCVLSLDLDATKDHIDFFGQAMFKAVFKHSGGKGQSKYIPTAVTATGYTVAANGDYPVRRLFVARGLTTPANNGLKVTVVGSVAGEIKFAGLVAEAAPAAPANPQLEFAGIQGDAGEFEIDAQGNITSDTTNLTTLGLNVGQLIYIPSQAEALEMGDVKYAFDNAEYYGYAEIAKIEALKLTLKHRDWEVGAADASADNTVRIFFTKWIRNVARNSADERLESHAFEITYSDLADGPADAYEYLKGYMLDQTLFNFPAEGKVSMQLTFIGMSAEDPTAVRAAGPANALNPVTGLALNTSSDIKRLSVVDVDEQGVMTDFRDIKIALKNNIVGEKAVAHLGNRFTPLGVFMGEMDSEAYFTTPEIVSAVRDKRVLRLSVGGRNSEFGAVLQLPSTGAMEAKKKIEHNKLITISSKIAGFMDPTQLCTASMSMFAFLPTT